MKKEKENEKTVWYLQNWGFQSLTNYTYNDNKHRVDDSEHMIDSHIKKLTREEIAELEQITKQRWYFNPRKTGGGRNPPPLTENFIF